MSEVDRFLGKDEVAGSNPAISSKKPPDSGGFFFLPAGFIKGQMVRSFLLLLRFFDIMIGIVILGSFSEQRLSFRGSEKPVLTGEAFAKWVLCFEARRPISRQSGSIWYSLVPLVGACGRRKARRHGSSPNPARAE